MTNSNPLQDQLNAAAGQIATPTAEPIQQAQPVAPMTSPSASTVVGYAAPAAASPLTMDSNEVVSAGSVSDFVKLLDGGLSLDDEKFDPVKFKIMLEGADLGGSFRPCKMMNYNGTTGYVYTKTYDGVTTSSSNPAHNGLPWNVNVERILSIDGKAFDFIGYELTLETAEDVKSRNGKKEIPAGSMFGYSTPYTAAKQIKAIWDKYSKTNRGETLIIELSGEEVSNNGKEFKKLIVNVVGLEKDLG